MKNVIKVTVIVAIALIVSATLNLNINNNSGSIDLAALQSANAWNFCVDWSPQDVGQPSWFDVSHRFPQSEINRIDAEYPEYRIIASNKKFCLLGGFDVCQNLDIAVSQFEVSARVFGPLGNQPPL